MKHMFKAAMMVSALALSAAAQAKEPAPLADLVSKVDIPYEEFTLDNGMRVIVHEDRKAPIVAVSIWYDVGSKHEPKGKTGYAHLFEHIMFNGSENAPGDYFVPLKKIGATALNGTTWLDRTNYFQNVPTSALEAALFLESDRMGHLLGAVTQEKLDNQIGVVQNEKRGGDNQPFGLVGYRQTELLFPSTHPYGHDTIGSLEDLQAASLDDMKTWFKDHYGPNNAILVLAGDIDAKTAKPLVQKWFGDIKRGKKVKPVVAPIVTLDKPVYEVMKDKVATTRIYRNWIVPGLDQPGYTELKVGLSVLGGLASSRLDNIMVREEKNAVAVSAGVTPFVHGSFVNIQADVKPGEDADEVAKRLDAIIADFIQTGPTADEVARVASSTAANQISGFEQIGGFGGKAVALASGALYANDPSYYKKELGRLAATTPESVVAAMKKWLTRPVVGIRVVPGERETYKEVGSGGATKISLGGAKQFSKTVAEFKSPSYYKQPGTNSGGSVSLKADRSKLPDVGEAANVDFPDVETATLSNGIKVRFAKRRSVPIVRVAVSFDAGVASDPKDKLGLQSFVSAMLDEGTTSMNSVQIAEAQERLGAALWISGGRDRTSMGVRAMTPNLGQSLDLLADVVKNPAFEPSEIERIRTRQLTSIKQSSSRPRSIALKAIAPMLFGEAHPYGNSFASQGNEQSVKAITRADLSSYHNAWIRPEKAEIFAVGDTDLKTLIPELEVRFGKWKGKGAAAGAKNFDVKTPDAVNKIVVIHRPNSPQSMIVAGQLLSVKGTDDLLALNASNEIMSGGFLSRTNMDLRETKGWSYGVRGSVVRNRENVPYVLFAPVQTDKTGPSVAALLEQVEGFVGDKGVTKEELERTVNGNIRQLPGNFERSTSVLGQMQSDALFNRSSDYIETVAGKYRKLDAVALDEVMRETVDPSKFTWVVVGDVNKIKSQIEALGLPIEYRGFDSKAEAAKEDK